MAGNVYLVFGSDEYVVSAKASERVNAHVTPENRALGLETIDGAANDSQEAVQAVDQCLAAVMTRGMFAGTKVVWFKNVTFLAETGTARSDPVKARVGRLAEIIQNGLDPSTTLVISAEAVGKRYALYKACKKNGEIFEFAVPEKAYQADRAAGEVLRELVAARQLRMGADVRAAFLERVGTNTRQIANELDKLCVFLDARKQVTVEDIRTIVSLSRASPAWDLADAFGKRELPRALDLTRQLLFQKESPILLAITIEGRIRDLMIYKEGLQRKWLTSGGSPYGNKGNAGFSWGRLPDAAASIFAEELERDPRSTHSFRIKLLAEQAANFSRAELRACQRAALVTHEQLVSSSLPPSVALETLLIKMLS